MADKPGHRERFVDTVSNRQRPINYFVVDILKRLPAECCFIARSCASGATRNRTDLVARYILADFREFHAQAAKDAAGVALRSLPAVGHSAYETARRMKNSLKQLVAPISIFETLGLKYGGPIDGHDLQAVEKALRDAARIRGPVVVHVVTNKGQGYGPAVADKIDKFHGVSTFDPDSGTTVKKAPDWTDIFGEALCEAAEADPTIVAITAAMASSTGLLEFAKRFPDRFFDVGIAEQHAVTFAAGLAMRGLHPVVCIYSTFLQRAFDQIACDVALHQLPVTFIVDRAGITGNDGPSHHGMLDLAFLRCIPGMTVSAPSSPDELRRLFATAIASEGPFSLRFPRGAAPGPGTAALDPLPIPSSEVLHRGHDIAILAVGKMVAAAMQAKDQLAAAGVSATVVDARFVKPLDPKLSVICARHRGVITVEDGVASGGFGSAVTDLLSTEGVTVPVIRMGLPDHFIEHGAQGSLLAKMGLDANGIAAAALALIPAGEVLAG